MNQSNSVCQSSQNHANDRYNQNDAMIDQEYEQSNNFTQRQIQIIRSYIGEMNIQKSQRDESLSKIVQKIQRQTQLQSKSAKQIQSMIHKILYNQSSSGFQKISNKQAECGVQARNNMQREPMIIGQRREVRHKEAAVAKPVQEENSLQPKSLFKCFHQAAINIKAMDQSQLGSCIGENSLPGIKKINLFTKPSIQVTKKSSNGFMSVMDSNANKNRQINEAEFQPNTGTYFPAFYKKATKQFKQSEQTHVYKSKRKIKPTPSLLIDPAFTPQQKIEWIQNNTNDCHSILQKKIVKKAGNVSKQPFYLNQKFIEIYNQYFYSNYDKIYFNQESQFGKLLSHLGFAPKKMALKDLKLVKQALPTPKLFNIEFVISQQSKLNQFRSQMRLNPKERTRSEDTQLSVGKQVTALHPVCGHLHSGAILAIYKENQYMVKFTRPELGTQKVLDINICTRFLSNTNKATIQNLDYESIVTVIKLLEYKGDLMEKFKEYNNIFEQLKESNKEADNLLLQQYGWIGSTINILSMGLRHIIAKFRIRGLTPSNKQLVGKNFSSLLINPLNLMSKQLENSSQNSDNKTSNQIKRMQISRSKSRIQQLVQRLSQKNSHFLTQSQMNPQQKQSMSILVKNFLAVLVNLRYQGRSFNIQENKYLNNILAMIDGEYSEYFNQIYANIHSIVKKIGESD